MLCVQEFCWRRQWHPTPVLLPGKSHRRRSLVSCSPWGHKESDTTDQLHFHALEKEMATPSNVLAWRIPGTGKPGGLPSMGLHRVGHDWSDLAAAANHADCKEIQPVHSERDQPWEFFGRNDAKAETPVLWLPLNPVLLLLSSLAKIIAATF